jgi:hypothetical protein
MTAHRAYAPCYCLPHSSGTVLRSGTQTFVPFDNSIYCQSSALDEAAPGAAGGSAQHCCCYLYCACCCCGCCFVQGYCCCCRCCCPPVRCMAKCFMNTVACSDTHIYVHPLTYVPALPPQCWMKLWTCLVKWASRCSKFMRKQRLVNLNLHMHLVWPMKAMSVGAAADAAGTTAAAAGTTVASHHCCYPHHHHHHHRCCSHHHHCCCCCCAAIVIIRACVYSTRAAGM